MKRLIFICLFIFSISGCSSQANPVPIPAVSTLEAANPLPDSQPVIRLTSGEWRPYTGENLPDFGCDSRIVAGVFSHLGYTVEFGFFPWARGFHLAETGEWDGTFEWADTLETRQAFFVSRDPISEQAFVFFHKIDHPFDWEKKEDLAGRIIGVTSGYLYSGLFDDIRNDPDFIFQEASTDEANFEKLLAGRIDVFPMEINVGLSLIREIFTAGQVSQLTYHKKPLSVFEPYVFLTKKNPANEKLMQQFDTAFEFFVKSGELQRLTDSCDLEK